MTNVPTISLRLSDHNKKLEKLQKVELGDFVKVKQVLDESVVKAVGVLRTFLLARSAPLERQVFTSTCFNCRCLSWTTRKTTTGTTSNLSSWYEP